MKERLAFFASGMEDCLNGLEAHGCNDFILIPRLFDSLEDGFPASMPPVDKKMGTPDLESEEVWGAIEGSSITK